jgi:hypothetical protein
MDAVPPVIILALAAVQGEHLLFFAGVTMITISLLHRYRKRHRKTAQQRLTPQEQIERGRQLRGLQGDLERLMVEVEQLAKRFSSQLEAKSIALEHLLDQAERRIATLERLTQKPLPAAPPQETSDHSLGLVGQVGPEGPRPPEPTQDAPGAREQVDALARRIYAMSDAGLGPRDIARQLDEQVGKVELILALRQAG